MSRFHFERCVTRLWQISQSDRSLGGSYMRALLGRLLTKWRCALLKRLPVLAA